MYKKVLYQVCRASIRYKFESFRTTLFMFDIVSLIINFSKTVIKRRSNKVTLVRNNFFLRGIFPTLVVKFNGVLGEFDQLFIFVK